MAHSANQAVESLRKEQREQRKDAKKAGDRQLDRALKDTFPASDPVAPQVPIKPGAPKRSA